MTVPAKIPHFSAMSSNSVDLDETWMFLKRGLDHIMIHGDARTFPDYAILYTMVYNYCTQGRTDGNRTHRSGLNGSDLYSKLSTYYIEHLKPIIAVSETLQDVDLLKYYAAEWDRYTTSANFSNRLFAFLNRHWVKCQRDEGKKNVYEVYTLALVQWKDHFFMHMQNDNAKLTNALLRLITQQRNGEVIEQTVVKKVVESFVLLGLDSADPNKECLDIYKEHIEAPYIAVTEQYYKTESDTFLSQNTVSDYLKKAEDCLTDEEGRVEGCFHPETREDLIRKCEHILIREHAQLLWDSFQTLFDSDKDEDLRRMYALLSRLPEGLEPLRKRFEDHVKQAELDFDKDEDLQRMHARLSRIPEGLEPLQKLFEDHVKQAGLDAMSKLVGEIGANTDSLDPKAYVDALLEVHKKYSETIARCFKGEVGFTASLDKACREFVNRNAAIGTSSSKSPELIAKHSDLILRKSNKMAEEEDIESALNRLMILFKYLEDKDVFQSFYRTKLSKRLIHGVSASDESEAGMISKLKEVCGFEYTNKLQHMFTDMSLSKDITDAFKERMAQNHDDMDITFTIMVLGTNFWPLLPPTHDFIIPTEILPTYDRFREFYQAKHSGRKLTWLWNYSKNELRTNYLNQKYILMTSSYQMAVLLQYNRNDTLSFEELQQATNISKELLLQVLALLVKAKILINEETDQYDLNPNFKSKKIRVNLNLPIKADMKAESSYVLRAVDEDRKYVIQATIVRIMKARKMMKHQHVIQEVTGQISQRFAPKIPDIDKAIKILLEKEYIERVDGLKDTFAYVA